MTSPAARESEQFRRVITRRMGLDLDDSKSAFLAELLQRRLSAQPSPVSAAAYLAQLAQDGAREELRVLSTLLTVGETYFFRNADHFRVLAEVVLPARTKARGPTHGGPGTLRFLSAACSSGEEAYSIAMMCRQTLPADRWNVQVRGVDINPNAIKLARAGRYAPWSLRETPPEVQARWFRQQGRDFVLDRSLGEGVRFDERNLLEHDDELWWPESYDAIFCRNVLMYFTPEAARAVVRRLARALAPEGYLFLGHAETLRGLSHDFTLLHTHDTFYYQRKATLVSDSQAGAGALDSIAPPRPMNDEDLKLDLSQGVSWMEAVHRSAQRIQALSVSAPEEAKAAGAARPDLGAALDLLRHERFADALAVLARLPTDWANDPDVLLLRAVLLTHSGARAEAERACRTLLEQDALSAGAHYVLALCREEAGDPDAALTHDQMAAYLDPSFAMPRLHMGLLARRAGDPLTAARELDQAATLLEREDASRLILFGGGFSRDALRALCHAPRPR